MILNSEYADLLQAELDGFITLTFSNLEGEPFWSELKELYLGSGRDDLTQSWNAEREKILLRAVKKVGFHFEHLSESKI